LNGIAPVSHNVAIKWAVPKNTVAFWHANAKDDSDHVTKSHSNIS